MFISYMFYPLNQVRNVTTVTEVVESTSSRIFSYVHDSEKKIYILFITIYIYFLLLFATVSNE